MASYGQLTMLDMKKITHTDAVVCGSGCNTVSTCLSPCSHIDDKVKAPHNKIVEASLPFESPTFFEGVPAQGRAGNVHSDADGDTSAHTLIRPAARRGRMGKSPPDAEEVPPTTLSCLWPPVGAACTTPRPQAPPPLSPDPSCSGTPTTTLLVKNIPQQYSLKQLLGHWTPDGAYDMLHYPCNLKTRRRLGFCFINFLSPELASEFCLGWHGRTFPGEGSMTPLEITGARQQGVMATLEFYRGYRAERMLDDDLVPALFEGARRLHTKTVLKSLGIIPCSVLEPHAKKIPDARRGKIPDARRGEETYHL